MTTDKDDDLLVSSALTDQPIDLYSALPFRLDKDPYPNSMKGKVSEELLQRAAQLHQRLGNLVPLLQRHYDARSPLQLSAEEVDTLVRLLYTLCTGVRHVLNNFIDKQMEREEQLYAELKGYGWLLAQLSGGKPVELTADTFERMNDPNLAVLVERTYDKERDVYEFRFTPSAMPHSSDTMQ
jgi:hypothetical protein